MSPTVRWRAWLRERLDRTGISADARIASFHPGSAQPTFHVCVTWTDAQGEHHHTADIEPSVRFMWSARLPYHAASQLLAELS